MRWIEKFRAKDNKEIAITLLLISMASLMLFFALCRLLGVDYFSNNYTVHLKSFIAIEIILFILKFIDSFLIIMILTKLKIWQCFIISFLWCNIYWFVNNNAVSFILDLIYVTLIPFVFSKFDYIRITHGIILFLFITLYQFVMAFSRYTIDFDSKFNYIAMIASMLDYKLFIATIYCYIKLRRYKMLQKDRPSSDEKNYGGGGCFFFWGEKFDKACTMIGKIFIGIITLGIVPLVMLCRKKKQSTKL